MKRKQRKVRAVTAWAWMFPDVNDGRKWYLCRWAEPFRAALDENKPTDDAAKVSVTITIRPSKRAIPRRTPRGK